MKHIAQCLRCGKGSVNGSYSSSSSSSSLSSFSSSYNVSSQCLEGLTPCTCEWKGSLPRRHLLVRGRSSPESWIKWLQGFPFHSGGQGLCLPRLPQDGVGLCSRSPVELDFIPLLLRHGLSYSPLFSQSKRKTFPSCKYYGYEPSPWQWAKQLSLEESRAALFFCACEQIN